MTKQELKIKREKIVNSMLEGKDIKLRLYKVEEMTEEKFEQQILTLNDEIDTMKDMIKCRKKSRS
jgi:hypothetical protein